MGQRRARRARTGSRPVQKGRNEADGVLCGSGHARVKGEGRSQTGPARARGKTRLLSLPPGTLRLRLLPVVERCARQSEMLLRGFFDPFRLVAAAFAQR